METSKEAVVGKGISQVAEMVHEAALDGIPKVVKSYYDSGEVSSMTIKISIDDKGAMKVISSYALKDEPVILEVEVMGRGEDVNILNYVDVHKSEHSKNDDQIEMFEKKDSPNVSVETFNS